MYKDIRYFDETWPQRVEERHRQLRSEGASFEDAYFLIVLDVYTELTQFPALYGEAFAAETRNAALKQAEDVHGYFLQRLEDEGLT